jgi:hypothetical protein
MNQLPAVPTPKNYTTFSTTPTVHPGSDDNATSSTALTDEEQKLLERRHKEESQPPVQYGNTHVIEPLGKHKKHKPHSKSKAKSAKHTPPAAKPAMKQTPDPDILSYAKDNNLSVETIAHEVNQKREPETPQGEVVVPLR